MNISSPTDWLPLIHPRSLKHLTGALTRLVEGRLWLQVMVAMVLGVAAGFLLGPEVGLVSSHAARGITDWLALPGSLFLALVQMIVIPLVIASIILGLASGENLAQLKQIGLVAALFFLGTTVAAIGMGIGLSILLQPGRYLDSSAVTGALGAGDPIAPAAAAVPASLPHALVELVPTNPLAAMLNADMLAVVLFSLVVGVALVTMRGAQAKPILDLLGSVQKVAMTVVGWAMRLIPVAVFGLLAQLTARVGLGALVGVGAYVGVVLTGVVVLLCVYWIAISRFLGRSLGETIGAMKELQLLAFSTSSSAACMPMSIQTAEEKLGIRPSVAQVVIPLGVTVNMNGTALYQGVATIFLAQVFGVELDRAALLLLVITAVGASIGTPGTPGAGVVILASVLGSAGIPVAGIGLILGVSRIIDMSVTVVNVSGDLAAASFIERRLAREQSGDDERAAHARREQEHAQSGADVLVDSSTEAS